MLNGWFLLFAFVGVFSVFTHVRGECSNHRINIAPNNIYNDLKCIPKYAAGQEDCIEEYDCSHIFKRPENTCHFNGKSYKVGEQIDNEELRGVWNKDCTCSESLEFQCPVRLDGCAEGFVRNYPKPGCYLRRELNRYCAVGEICPPFDGNAKCVVNGVTHDEGDEFSHPDKKCVNCVCDKSFDGKLEPPFCQPINCTYGQLRNSKAIDNFCAPLYKGNDICCPDSWVCPSETTVYRPNPLASSTDNLGLHCKFGEKSLTVGEYAVHTDPELGEVTCECALPPFLYCQAFEQQKRPTP